MGCFEIRTLPVQHKLKYKNTKIMQIQSKNLFKFFTKSYFLEPSLACTTACILDEYNLKELQQGGDSNLIFHSTTVTKSSQVVKNDLLSLLYISVRPSEHTFGVTTNLL